MDKVSIKRSEKDSYTFRGEPLVHVDDREWMGIAPNWWELTLYRADDGQYILASVFHRNYPRRKTLYGALHFESPEDAHSYLLEKCNGPAMIADALLNRARRKLRDLDNPLPPLQLFESSDDEDAMDDVSPLHARASYQSGASASRMEIF